VRLIPAEEQTVQDLRLPIRLATSRGVLSASQDVTIRSVSTAITVRELKTMIQEATEMPADSITLSAGPVILEDAQKLAAYANYNLGDMGAVVARSEFASEFAPTKTADNKQVVWEYNATKISDN